jgi:hypothetical protein
LDPVEALVRLIHDELIRVSGIADIRLGVGNLEDKLHGIYPRVVWIEQGGRFEMGTSQADGIETPAAVLIQRPDMLVKCWGETLEAARALAFNTVLATQRVQQARVEYSRDYNCPAQTEGRHNDAGAVIEIRVYLWVEIPIDTEQTRRVVTIGLTELEAKANGEVVFDGQTSAP